MDSTILRAMSDDEIARRSGILAKTGDVVLAEWFSETSRTSYLKGENWLHRS